MSPTQSWYQHWSKLGFKQWCGDDTFLPSHLSAEARSIAKQEISSITECFYTQTHLPVITPENCEEFIRVMAQHVTDPVILWTWFSGSSTLACVMSSTPFHKIVLFPVDLRYGWDVQDPRHQELLMKVDKVFKPYLTTKEVRCKFWSTAGFLRDPAKTDRLQQSEKSTHQFCLQHTAHVQKDGRRDLYENPKSSRIWSMSVLEGLNYVKDMKTFTLDMCAHSSKPDGQRHRKSTTLKTTLTLKKCVQRCKCKCGHIELFGYDKEQHALRTAAAAVYPRKFCSCLCSDILANYDSDNKKPSSTRASKAYFNPADSNPEGTIGGVARLPPGDLMEGLRKTNVQGAKFEYGLCRSLFSDLDQQLIKACLLELLDYGVRHYGVGGEHNFTFAQPGTTTQRIPAVLIEVLKPRFVVSTLVLNMHCATLHPVKDTSIRVIIGADKKGHFLWHLDLDWLQSAEADRWQSPFEDPTQYPFVFQLYGELSDDGQRVLGSPTRKRVFGKQPGPSRAVPPIAVPAPDKGVEELEPIDEDKMIRINPKNITKLKPHQDLKELPQKLVHASKEERRRLLMGLHERFWHASPQDMIRLLQAALVPREICVEAADVAASCEHCRKFKARMHKPTIKSHMATQFNECVHHDLFFLWDETFMLLVDECCRWKTGDQLPNKEAGSIVKALVNLWLRVFGPPQSIVSDQEGGLCSHLATRLLDSMGITRVLVGQGGATTKAVVERHIALCKYTMLKLESSARKDGLEVSHSEICQESCMSQNLLLDFNGATPQQAVIGTHRDYTSIENQNLDSITGSLQQRPDAVESLVRLRMLAKQAILQGIVEDRFTQASKIKQHAHPVELLLPGQIVDVWRQPTRKDEHGWRGPAEILSIERRAGSAIVRYQGQPLIAPLNYLRKHVLTELFSKMLWTEPSHFSEVLMNPKLSAEVHHTLYNNTGYSVYQFSATEDEHAITNGIMDIVDGGVPGKVILMGYILKDGNWVCRPSEEHFAQHRLTKLCKTLFKDYLRDVHGIMHGTGLRRMPAVPRARWAMLLRWHRDDRARYTVQLISPRNALTFRGEWQRHSTLFLYSYSHYEPAEEYFPRNPELGDLDESSIPWQPDEMDADDLPSPLQGDLPAPLPPAVPPAPPPQAPPPPDDPGSAMPPAPHASGSGTVPPSAVPNLAPDEIGRYDMTADDSDLEMPNIGDDDDADPPMPPASGADGPSLPQPPSSIPDALAPMRRQLGSPSKTDGLAPPAVTPPTIVPVPLVPNGHPNGHDDTTMIEPPGALDRSRSRSPSKVSNPAKSNSRKPSPSSPNDAGRDTGARGSNEGPPVLPLADNDSNEVPTSDTRPDSSNQEPSASIAPAPAEHDSQETIPYEDADRSRSRDYGDEDKDKQLYSARYSSHQIGWCQPVPTDVSYTHAVMRQTDEEDVSHAMWTELSDEAGQMSDICVTPQVEYLVDNNSGEILRVDEETAGLTDDDMRRYAKLVEDADHRELEQFIKHQVFEGVHRSKLRPGANVVDCIWVRKWAVHGVKVKSRMCSRGCFDKQKHVIEKHSSTATRLSQRMVMSLAMCEGHLYSYKGNGSDVDIESLDISTAFLQGLNYQDLAKHAKDLGFEHRFEREVYVSPPENVWRHFRKMQDCPPSLHVADNQRGQYVLKCLKAMYGFGDAPLMFQLALVSFLIQHTGATKSILDDNYLVWHWDIQGRKELVLVMTIHVDDLQLVGSETAREWIHDLLVKRFGELKRQRTPYTHAGLQLERLPSGTLFAHQQDFCSKLKTYPVNSSRDPEESLGPLESTTFRSLTCSALWACQTRTEELCQVTTLQTALKSPKVKDIMAINTVIKRLKSPRLKHGLFFHKLSGPLRVVSVSDAGSATKSSNYANEGIAVLLGEDCASSHLEVDKFDFLQDDQVNKQGGKFHLLVGSASKAKRVSYSTSHAETNAAAKAIPLGQMIALRYAEPELIAQKGKMTPLALESFQEKGLCPVLHDHFIDCMDLWELSCGMRGIPQDKGMRLGVLAIREERKSCRLRRLFHVQTHWMLADQLTKYTGYVSQSLHELISSGHWTIEGRLRVRHGFGGGLSNTEELVVADYLRD